LVGSSDRRPVYWPGRTRASVLETGTCFFDRPVRDFRKIIGYDPATWTGAYHQSAAFWRL